VNYKNLVEIFCSRRRKDIGITFIDSAEEKRFLSYDEIYLEAEAILFNLQSAGLKPGDQLVFQINDNRDFVIFFWACLLGKIIPIPVTLAANDE
jgi:acyl-CoA synthetase (AMP-forming)/AMP-acid ligase II